ncbi:MAG: ABC transporter ATP-binding protein [Elusimicrobia bacterium]|nr:ABC transporter ATP-binding protein [Elusimicrobiota bacterium]
MQVKENIVSFYFTLIKEHKWKISSLFATLVLTSFLSAYPIVLIKKTIDSAVSPAPLKTILFYGGAYFLFHAFNAFFGRWFEYYSSYTSNLMAHNLRCRMFSHLAGLPVGFYSGRKKTDFLFKLVQDCDVASVSFLEPLAFLGRSGLTFLFGFYYMWNIDKEITLFMIPIGIAAALTMTFSGKGISRREKDSINSKESLWAEFMEFMAGIKEVKIFNREASASLVIESLSASLKSANTGLVGFISWSKGINQFLMMAVIAMIMIYGAVKVKFGFLTIGGLSAVMMYNGLLIDPMAEALSLYQAMMAQFINVRRIHEIFASEPETGGGTRFTGLKESIEFKNVSFKYEKDKLALKDFNLKINKGDKTAVVGLTGAGKSTLIKLLCRFYEPAAGSINMDGRNIKEYELKDLRAAVSTVFQDFFVFNGAILENIMFSNPLAPKRLVKEVMEISGLADLTAFSVAGEDGKLLSGGQRQKTAIARALLKPADVYVFDESFSNLDSVATSEILEKIHGRFSDKTIIYITHKLTTVINVPKIILISNGSVIDAGSHAELMRRNRDYETIYNKQFLEFEIVSPEKLL